MASKPMLWRVCLVFWIGGWASMLEGVVHVSTLGLWRPSMRLAVAKWTNKHIYRD